VLRYYLGVHTDLCPFSRVELVLIPLWGIEGAALASLISYAVLGGTSFVVMLQRSRFTLKQATVSDQGLLYELNSLIKLLK